jgi:hypothetical protein
MRSIDSGPSPSSRIQFASSPTNPESSADATPESTAECFALAITLSSGSQGHTMIFLRFPRIDLTRGMPPSRNAAAHRPASLPRASCPPQPDEKTDQGNTHRPLYSVEETRMKHARQRYRSKVLRQSGQRAFPRQSRRTASCATRPNKPRRGNDCQTAVDPGGSNQINAALSRATEERRRVSWSSWFWVCWAGRSRRSSAAIENRHNLLVHSPCRNAYRPRWKISLEYLDGQPPREMLVPIVHRAGARSKIPMRSV